MLKSIIVFACFACVGAGEAFEFSRPAQPICKGTSLRDLGPPEGCDHGPGPHREFTLDSRATVSSGVSAITATSSGGAF
jgi:hypothetical protein